MAPGPGRVPTRRRLSLTHPGPRRAPLVGTFRGSWSGPSWLETFAGLAGIVLASPPWLPRGLLPPLLPVANFQRLPRPLPRPQLCLPPSFYPPQLLLPIAGRGHGNRKGEGWDWSGVGFSQASQSSPGRQGLGELTPLRGISVAGNCGKLPVFYLFPEA